MAQKTNLNVNPYFDDFVESGVGARDKNYYKVLFNPGRAIQARELNTLQSILQNQIESFGSHIFKEGSVVIPGNITYDGQFYAVKVNPLQFNINLTLYIENFIGKIIKGQISETTATLQYVQLPNDEVEYITLYVKYLDSDSNFEFNFFQEGEELYSDENIVYGNTTIAAGSPFATLINSDATSIGSAASVNEGVYFVRGTFVRVPKQTVVLDYYSNTPSYRVGLRINEEIVTAEDDSTIYDNAKGFTNYAAPGADRFKISLFLTKKLLSDFNDTDFIELLRVENGSIRKIENKNEYLIIKDYLAQRTYDESGNYVVTPFDLSLNNSLNDRLGNDGLFFSQEKTNQQNDPSDDLMCLKISPGKAYVRGYDIETGVEILDVPKTRTTQNIPSVNIPFEMGNLIRVNNVSGTPKQRQTVYLQSRRKNSNTVSAGTTIGSARIYNFNVTDAAYSNAATNWDLYVYDLQTYTILTLNGNVSLTQVPKTSFIRGKSSGASGYAVNAGNGTNLISVSETSGTFVIGEQILINESEALSRSITAISKYGIDDVKSIHQPTTTSGFTTSFLADATLDKVLRSEVVTIQAAAGETSQVTVTSPGTLSGINVDNIVIYQLPNINADVYNRVESVDASKTTMVLRAVSNVSGVCNGSLPTSTYNGVISLGIAKARNEENAYLYAELPNQNISFVDLTSSTITFSAQSNKTFTPSGSPSIGYSLEVGLDDFDLGTDSGSASFEVYDEERYSIFYSDGTIDNLTSDKIRLNSNSTLVTFLNIQNKEISSINATFVKNSIQSKNKELVKSKTININLSKNTESGVGINTSINDGLTHNQYYGLRVQDSEISLNYPDVVNVLAVYESLDINAPVLDVLSFNATANVSTNAIIGENIIGNSSNTIARIVTKPFTNKLGIVYLNNNRFSEGEEVTFQESNINTTIVQIEFGKYKNITNKYTLDKGQKKQYYDYSKIVRKSGEDSPSRKLLIVFDYYSVPSSDTGDLFTVNSYRQERYSKDIPLIPKDITTITGNNFVRASDTLDFRPRVSVFTSTSSSPFCFSSRSFGDEPKIVMSPNESALVGYNFYLGRIDKVYLDKLGAFTVLEGIPSISPKEPIIPDDVMEVATIVLPPYLYDVKDSRIFLVDNRRYTMRDIGKIEDRVENLERVTSLSLLELNTQTLQIQDAEGFNRFKTGFFVDDFKNSNLVNVDLSTIEVDTENSELIPRVSRSSLALLPTPKNATTDEDLDFNVDFNLFDSNVKKTGDAITLNYKSIEWIKQLFATKVENVNPFHVVSYNGTVKLNPESDTWVRTVRIGDTSSVSVANRTERSSAGRLVRQLTTTSTSSTDRVVATGTERFMRSRNTGFSVVNLKPTTRYYQFLDSNSSVDFIPKLIEIANDSTLQNYGSSSSFAVGETVRGFVNGRQLISFRVAQSNHKIGPFNNPQYTYSVNPYFPNETIPQFYSPSSKTLNIDINSLCSEAQGLYSGYLVSGMILVGQTSRAVAYVKDLRLISDNNGFLEGSFFLRDPNTNPPPSVRIETGTKVYKITSSPTNEVPLPGSKLIASAETNYRSQGTFQVIQRVITTSVTRTTQFHDPLAQSFSVSGSIEAPNGNGPDEDVNGAYLTAVDIFFASKDSGNAPLTVEVRTVELGTPTRTILGIPATLNPSDIQVSSDASVATKVVFDYPIYLAPGLEYAIVLLAPQSDQYEVWIAEMGEKTIETSVLPDSQSIRYTQQFAIGSLFKSQNGSIWTANQYQDLKFILYKAEFTSLNGSVFLNNPTLNSSNGYVRTLETDSITILPRQIKLGITTITDSNTISNLSTGRKVSSTSSTNNYGYIVGTGSSVSSAGITTGGTNYANTTDVGTYSISGNGTGLKLNITATSGEITSIAVSSSGNGYGVGDIVGIVTSEVANGSGSGALITINAITGLDTLYLSNVQGEIFNSGTPDLKYYEINGTSQTLSGIKILDSSLFRNFYSGNYFKVNHYEHNMYAKNNKVKLSNVGSDILPTTLTIPLSTSDSIISVASTSNFANFEDLPVSTTNPGYIQIENEIIQYTLIGSSNTLEGITRGISSTIPLQYSTGTQVYKYELGGVSLLRINTTHDISDDGIDFDSYYLEFNRSNFSSNVTNRTSDQETDGEPANSPQISFNRELICGGDQAEGTENIQFSRIIPNISALIPGSVTNIGAQIKTVSGTSISGNEVSFIDQGYETVELGVENKLNSVRLVCSEANEDAYISAGTGGNNKSFTMKLDLGTTDKNLSPMIFWKESSTIFLNSRLNDPIEDYESDGRVNSILNDPHSAIYISNRINLKQPANSLKVILTAYRHSSADFRVLYSLIRPDSSEVEQSFELFPGYKNVRINSVFENFPIVIDPSKNSGLPDSYVPDSLDDQFLEYEFSANNLGSFTGYVIKIVMVGKNQAYPPRIKDLRSIALA